jgi:hypothetical protein
MWEREDSQEVGSEAAILERVRNSSLVEWSCADNVTGLKLKAEAADFHFRPSIGRSEQCITQVVWRRGRRIDAWESRDGSGRGASISAEKRR